MSDNRRYRKPYYRHNKPNGEKKQDNSAPHGQFSTCIELEKALEEKLNEENIVKAVAISWNKYAWYEEAESKLTAEDEKYREACENTDAWGDEYNKMVLKLKEFVGLDNDSVFALPEISALMEKYGFTDTDGTWQKSRADK